MLVELMAVKKHNNILLVCDAGKYPHLVSPIIEKAKRILSSCTPLDPKRTHIQELTPTRIPSPVCMTKRGMQREDTLSPRTRREQLLDAKFEDDSFDQKVDTPQESEPIQMVSPKVSIETVPKIIHPLSSQSPLPDDVLLTPVKYPHQFCVSSPEHPDMEIKSLVEYISFINSPMNTDCNTYSTDKPNYIFPLPPKNIPTIQLPGVLVAKAEAQKLSTQAIRLLKISTSKSHGQNSVRLVLSFPRPSRMKSWEPDLVERSHSYWKNQELLRILQW
ncbi:hypothetical protein DSO57_1005993 [Entomophthora muscae]|uniref:Uncharacterized protein n=1 Tax=Entomophthora muscae TaxID=34485 RepID=A0ACC2SL30_9FUNG|nr:hypothetical protein DSO57_1005993 [Entomophthora muscae]